MKQFCLLFPVCLCFCSFGGEKNETKTFVPTSQSTNQTLRNIATLTKDTTLIIGGHAVDIRVPNKDIGIKGDILVLPGWNFPKEDWCLKSSLCEKALAQGYRLIMPEMGKSVYSSQLYEETLKEWRNFPTGKWLNTVMIPYLKEHFEIFTKTTPAFILGLSTGGRGVALTCLANPDLFVAAAALSGDYDQTVLPDDALMIGFYGNFEDYHERWTGKDNPTFQAAHFKTPLYLGHGMQDEIVPFQQTLAFYETLQRENPSLLVKLHLTPAGHNYIYWNSEVESMLQFFEEIMSQK
ncbi:MAG: alpha/beta hydrolase [Cytophagales bacterium]|nr:MAG: alpha/beta hydrolase [Cytophagales bacterium]